MTILTDGSPDSLSLSLFLSLSTRRACVTRELVAEMLYARAYDPMMERAKLSESRRASSTTQPAALSPTSHLSNNPVLDEINFLQYPVKASSNADHVRQASNDNCDTTDQFHGRFLFVIVDERDTARRSIIIVVRDFVVRYRGSKVGIIYLQHTRILQFVTFQRK